MECTWPENVSFVEKLCHPGRGLKQQIQRENASSVFKKQCHQGSYEASLASKCQSYRSYRVSVTHDLTKQAWYHMYQNVKSYRVSVIQI